MTQFFKTQNKSQTKPIQRNSSSEMIPALLNQMEQSQKLVLSVISDQIVLIQEMRQEYHKSQNLIMDLKTQIEQLEMTIRDQNNKIFELECLSDVYSDDGFPICNSEF